MSVFTLICILALFNRLRVVCLVLSGPSGTSCFSCSKYSRSLARLQLLKIKSVVVKLHPNSASYMQTPSVCRISVQNSIQQRLPFPSLWQRFRPKGHSKRSNAARRAPAAASCLHFTAVCSGSLVPPQRRGSTLRDPRNAGEAAHPVRRKNWDLPPTQCYLAGSDGAAGGSREAADPDAPVPHQPCPMRQPRSCHARQGQPCSSALLRAASSQGSSPRGRS